MKDDDEKHKKNIEKEIALAEKRHNAELDAKNSKIEDLQKARAKGKIALQEAEEKKTIKKLFDKLVKKKSSKFSVL